MRTFNSTVSASRSSRPPLLFALDTLALDPSRSADSGTTARYLPAARDCRAECEASRGQPREEDREGIVTSVATPSSDRLKTPSTTTPIARCARALSALHRASDA